MEHHHHYHSLTGSTTMATLRMHPGISFAEARDAERLSIAEQATVLALCANVKNQNPKHGLTTEEMHPCVGHLSHLFSFFNFIR